MKLRNTTKMAFKAAIAIAIAECIEMYFYLDRGYWVTLTAMALTTQTWGESVKRSFERVGMTILGGIAGTMLYFYSPVYNSTALLLFALFFIFFTLYLIKIYYLIAMFFLTCFVVFLFALISDWTVKLLELRILDTMLGALIALVVGFFFFSLKTDVVHLFIEHLQKIKSFMLVTFHEERPPKSLITGHLLAVDAQKIKKDALSIRYELLFHRLNSRDFNNVLNYLTFCTQYVINLVEAYQWLAPHLTEENREMVTLAVNTTAHNMDTIIKQLQKHTHTTSMLPATDLTELLKKAISADPSRFATLESDALGFFNLMYFFKRLNTLLNEIYVIVCKAY